MWVDVAKNRRRHWSISLEPTLFHPEGALVRRWGRLGQYTRTGSPDPLPARQALAEARKQVQSKLRKGYVVQACSWDGLLPGAPATSGRTSDAGAGGSADSRHRETTMTREPRPDDDVTDEPLLEFASLLIEHAQPMLAADQKELALWVREIDEAAPDPD